MNIHTHRKSIVLPKDKFTVGIISDTQLPPTKQQLRKKDAYLKNLIQALTVFKARGTDMILFAGDIGDLGTKFAFQTYANAFRQVYADTPPIVQTVMGNHDYWSRSFWSTIPHRRVFERVTGQGAWSHYVVNGFHFIGASPDCGSMTSGYQKILPWLAKELAAAAADAPDKPIFVMTHNQPRDTCYGAEDWGDDSLHELFSKYANLINFSGHSHYSILDERSIWQEAYTVISTQSLSYTELEPGKVNGTIPPHAEETPMGFWMEVSAAEIQLHRLCFAQGEAGVAQKEDMLWTFPMPYQNDQRFAFAPRCAKNEPPKMPNTQAQAVRVGKEIHLTFFAGTDDDFVHSYKVVADDSSTWLFFSDFYNGIEHMRTQVTLVLDAVEQPAAAHSFSIYALDSWGASSEACATAVLPKSNA